MGYCRECGLQVNAGNKFCPRCGVSAPMASDPLAILDPPVRSVREIKQERSVQRRSSSNEGVLAGVLACIFGILGIFTFAVVFVPLAAICSVIGLLLGLAGRSGSGFGLSLVGGVLTAAGFTVSPSLWLLFGGLFAIHFWQPNTAPSKPVAITSIAPQPAPPLTFASRETEAATQECHTKRLNGIYKTYEETARCTADRMMQAYSDANYKYMDLVAKINASRISLAEMIDRREVTDTEAQLRFSKIVDNIKEIERRRESSK
jgi:hypothetical protein